MEKIRIIPSVKVYELGSTNVSFNKINYIEKISGYEEKLLIDYVDSDIESNLHFEFDADMLLEAYSIDVYKEKIIIKYSNLNSRHNAILTLCQLLANVSKLIECHIYDKPDFLKRSIMIDISRNKVPNLSTLKKIIDEVSLVKINEIQLYVEGRSFYFESFKEYYEEKNDFLTGEDVLELIKLTTLEICFS